MITSSETFVLLHSPWSSIDRISLETRASFFLFQGAREKKKGKKGKKKPFKHDAVQSRVCVPIDETRWFIVVYRARGTAALPLLKSLLPYQELVARESYY